MRVVSFFSLGGGLDDRIRMGRTYCAVDPAMCVCVCIKSSSLYGRTGEMVIKYLSLNELLKWRILNATNK